MTSRRPLHRLSLLLAVALLCAPLLACGGGGPGASGLCEDTPSGQLEANAFKEPQQRDLAQSVSYTRSQLLQHHVDPPESIQLTEAAWKGASTAAAARGVEIKSDPGSLPGPSSVDRERALDDAFSKLSKEIEGTLHELHVTDAALSAMAASVNDSHTYYLPALVWKDFRRGRPVNRGFYTEAVADGLLITTVIPGSPADRELKPGDLVTAVNGTSMREPRGPLPNIPFGSPITFDVLRRGDPTVTKVELKPEPTAWITSRILDGDIAYLRVYEFITATTCDQFATMRKQVDVAMEDVGRDKPRAWIVDLRDNPGGYMVTGAYVAGRLGLEGNMITLRQRNGTERRLQALGNDAVAAAPLTFLLNAHSGSTSEVVAFSLQNLGKAKVIGTQSAGAVIAANAVPINQGAMMIAYANAQIGSSSKSIDKIGVTPDTKVALDLELLQREGRDSQLEAATSYLRQKLGR